METASFRRSRRDHGHAPPAGAGYMISFPGRRVLYVGRTADLHVERFPQ
jgi:hypothetical protein